MTEELDLLKRAWKKDAHAYEQVTENQIYQMIHKRSSSIVKWILMISIAELILWSGLSLLTVDESYLKTLEMYHIYTLFQVMTVANYVVLLAFIYFFYKNFKTISTTDTVKKLMNSIIKTRKTVQYYIWYNLSMIAIIFVIVSISQIMYDPNINKALSNIDYADSNIFWIIIALSYLVLFALIFGFFWLFYRLIYGFLMKRLYKNYEELKKIHF
jgi:NADH:ubiquinone oxidoreductase subunit K